jgi:hypothetical protein
MCYSRGEGFEKMSNAIDSWRMEQEKPEAERLSLKMFAKACGIPFSTLQGHITSDESKRIKLGSNVGRPSIIGSAEEAYIADALMRDGRAHEGVGVSEAADILERMMPHCSRRQLERALRHMARKYTSSSRQSTEPQELMLINGGISAAEQQCRWYKVNSFPWFHCGIIPFSSTNRST